MIIAQSLRRVGSLAFLIALIGTVGCSKTATTTGVSPASASADLALVPADAVGFVHVNLAEIWKSDLMVEFRKTYDAAGPKAQAAMEEQIVPPPSSFDRLSGFVVMNPNQGPQPFGILSFNKPIDAEALVKRFLGRYEERMIADKKVYFSRELAVYFPSDRQVMVGMAAGFESYLKGPVATDGAMKSAIELAGSRPLVLAGNLKGLPIPPEAFDSAPPDLQPLLRAQTVMMSIETAGDPKMTLNASYSDDTAAAGAEKSLGALKGMGKDFIAKGKTELEAKIFDPKRQTPRPAKEYPEVLLAVMALGSMNATSEMIDNHGIRKEGNSLTWSHSVPKQVGTFVSGYAAMGVAAFAMFESRELDSLGFGRSSPATKRSFPK